MKQFLALILFAGAALASLPASATTRGGECFYRYGVRDYRPLRGGNIEIYLNRNEIYNLELSYCRTLRRAWDFSFMTIPRSSSYVCEGDYLVTLDSSRTLIERCRIYSIEKVEDGLAD